MSRVFQYNEYIKVILINQSKWETNPQELKTMINNTKFLLNYLVVIEEELKASDVKEIRNKIKKEYNNEIFEYNECNSNEMKQIESTIEYMDFLQSII